MSRGKLIVIEGADGSGKTTQCELLVKKLLDDGQKVLRVKFPDYESRSSELVKMYLAGEIGQLDDINVYAASSFYAADRYISYKNKWRQQYLNGCTIVMDRYTTSNAVHQMSRLGRDNWDSYLDWLWNFEFNKLELPAPDIVLYLEVEPDVSRKLLNTRYGNQIINDIHENNLQYQLKCREAGRYLADKLCWKTIICSTNQELLSIEQISEKIYSAVQAELYTHMQMKQ